MRSPLLVLAVVCHLVMAGLYAWHTPAFEGPDENSHYEYAWHIANAGKLPINQDLAAKRGLPQSEGCMLAHHPPLYYTLLAGALLAADSDDTVFGPRNNPAVANAKDPGRHMFFQHVEHVPGLLIALRWISVALGVLTILCVHALGRLACPDKPAVAGLAALAVACLPMWSFLHGVLNSDVLATLLSSATILCCAKLLDSERNDLARTSMLGLLLGLAWLTKTTTLFLGGIALLTGITLLWRARGTSQWRAVLMRLLVAAVIAIGLSGWQFVRNASLYGDLLAMNAHDASFQVMPDEWRWLYFFGPLYPGDNPAPVTFIPTVFTSLLGRFGWFTCQPSPRLVWMGAVLAIGALAGLVWARIGKHRSYAPRHMWMMLTAAVLVFAGTAYFNTKVAQPQARLLFPAIAPCAVMFAAGLLRITSWMPGRAFGLLVFPGIALFAYSFTFAPAFDPELAKAPAEHRSLVGNIVDTRHESIQWTQQLGESPLQATPTLRWTDDGAPAGTRYTLYAFDNNGRVWLATHEWTHGNVVITGNEFAVPVEAWSFVPHGVPMSFRLRRLPTNYTDDAESQPASNALRFVRQ